MFFCPKSPQILNGSGDVGGEGAEAENCNAVMSSGLLIGRLDRVSRFSRLAITKLSQARPGKLGIFGGSKHHAEGIERCAGTSKLDRR